MSNRKNKGKAAGPPTQEDIDKRVAPLDAVIDPPRAPFTFEETDLDIEKTTTETAYIESHFTGKLEAGDDSVCGLTRFFKIVYRAKLENEENNFLCTNWAFHRLKNDPNLKSGHTFKFYEGEKAIDSTEYTVDQMTELLKDEYDLELITDGKYQDAVAVTWTNGKPNPRAVVGHIQVFYEGRWESKLSRLNWVITHNIDDFLYWGKGNDQPIDLQRAALYRRITSHVTKGPIRTPSKKK